MRCCCMCDVHKRTTTISLKCFLCGARVSHSLSLDLACQLALVWWHLENCVFIVSCARSFARKIYIIWHIVVKLHYDKALSFSMTAHTHTHTYSFCSWIVNIRHHECTYSFNSWTRIANQCNTTLLKIRKNPAHSKHFRNKTKHQVVARIRTRFISSRALIAKQPILLLKTMMNEMHVKLNLRLPSP